MLHSQEFKSLTKKFFLIAICLILFSLVCGKIMITYYEDYALKENARIVANLVSSYPELEEEIIEALQNGDDNIEFGKEILDKYAITTDNILPVTNSSGRVQIWLGIFLAFFLILVVITIVYFFHLARIYQKLDHINQYINEVLNNRYPISLKEYREGAFSTLKNDIYKITNKLKDQNEKIVSDKKYLESTLADISHQLKTPLTSMYVLNNLLKEDGLDKKKRCEFANQNEAQLARVEWLVTSLLKLARLESGTIVLKKEKVKVQELVEKSLEPVQIAIELKRQKVVMKGDKRIVVSCDKNWTIESIINVIKNAHEHTKEDGLIQIEWLDNPLYVELVIKDNGEGIKEEDIHHIFERFYKGSHNTKESIGIGLNMSHQILTRQNATISVSSEVGVGTTFTIRFYKYSV